MLLLLLWWCWWCWLAGWQCVSLSLSASPVSAESRPSMFAWLLTGRRELSDHKDGLCSRQQDPHWPRHWLYSKEHCYDAGTSWGRAWKIWFRLRLSMWIILDPVSKLPQNASWRPNFEKIFSHDDEGMLPWSWHWKTWETHLQNVRLKQGKEREDWLVLIVTKIKVQNFKQCWWSKNLIKLHSRILMFLSLYLAMTKYISVIVSRSCCVAPPLHQCSDIRTE